MVRSSLRKATPAESDLTEMRIEVYLDSCSIRGILETSQSRVSDHFNASDETICIKHARVVLRDGEPMATESRVFVNRSIILFAVDLTPSPSGHSAFQVDRDEREVTLNIGTIWIRGHAHLPIGGEMRTFFGGSSARFMPLTEATVTGHEATAPRTVLINRDQLRCMMAKETSISRPAAAAWPRASEATANDGPLTRRQAGI